MDNYCSQKKSDEVWYFAYGSNLYKPQMQTRVGEWKTSRKAHLKGWRLVFNVKSKRWGGGAANILKTEKSDEIVYGAVYLITCKQLDLLTEYEGVEPQDIQVESEGKEIQARTYIFRSDNPSLKPTPAYIETIISGLKQHGYKDNVVESIKKTIKRSM